VDVQEDTDLKKSQFNIILIIFSFLFNQLSY